MTRLAECRTRLPHPLRRAPSPPTGPRKYEVEVGPRDRDEPPMTSVGAPERAAAPLKFAVAYEGARMHYAIPAILAQEGMLARFYTDAVGNLGVVGAVGRVFPHAWRGPTLRRLFGRKLPPEIAAEQVETVTALTLAAPV